QKTKILISQERMTPPVHLKIVTLVVAKLSSHTIAIDNVVATISDLLIADLPLSKTVELSPADSLALLDLVWTRSVESIPSCRWSNARLLRTKEYYYKWEFSASLVQAIRRTDLKKVHWLLDHFSDCPVDGDAVEEAAKLGYLWVLQLLKGDNSHSGIEWSPKSLDLAAAGGHWDVVRWLHKRIGTPDTRRVQYGNGTHVADYAFQENNLKELQWALAQGFTVSTTLGRTCGISGPGYPWGTVRFLIEREDDNKDLVEMAMIRAAQIGDKEFLEWLVPHHDPCKVEQVLVAAGKSGNIAALQYLLRQYADFGMPHDPFKTVYASAKEGMLDAVNWLLERYSSDPNVDIFRVSRRYVNRKGGRVRAATVMDIAASHGHLEVLKLLHHADRVQRKKRKRHERSTSSNLETCRGCTTNAMDLAAAHGHLEVVKWLHAQRTEGCTAFAMNNAAANGHLQVVQWLHENRTEGCTTDAIDEAATRYCKISRCCQISSNCGIRRKPRECYESNSFVKNQIHIVQWLFTNRAEGCTDKAMDGAAANGNFELVKWLHENMNAKCTHQVMDEAARWGRLDILKWLQENRTEGCSSAAMSYAAKGGYLEILQWLYANCSISCTDQTLDEASKRGHFKVVRWIIEHGENLNMSLAMESAFRHNHLELACYLYDRLPVTSIRYGRNIDHIRDVARSNLYLI
ncbi:hypothetical protein F443_20650, partial [Phytophthora nicotianae P1569]